MLAWGLAIAFALAAAQRARRRDASPFLWGAVAATVCVVAAMFGDWILVISAGIAMVYAVEWLA